MEYGSSTLLGANGRPVSRSVLHLVQPTDGESVSSVFPRALAAVQTNRAARRRCTLVFERPMP